MLHKIILAVILTFSVTTALSQERSLPSIDNQPQGQPSALSDTAARPTVVVDQVVAIVGSSAILLSDVESMAARVREMRKEQGTLSARTETEEAFEMLLTQHLLSTRASIDSLNKELNPIDGEVDFRLNKMVDFAGSTAQLERQMGKPIYQIRADIALVVQQAKMAEAMERKVRAKAKISHSEVREFISSVPLDSMDLIPVQYIYSQIVKAPEQTDERRYAIRERLLEYRKRILSGDVTLSALARLYSADLGTAMRGGEMGPQPANEFVGPFTDAAKALKPGEVSEIVETQYGYHLIELISYDEPRDLLHIRHILLKPEFTVQESEQVNKELDSLVIEISNNRLSFEDAALKFSTDKETKENGGKAYNQRMYLSTGDIRAASSRFMPDELMPMDYRNLSRLRPGQISEPFLTMDNEGNTVYKVVRLDRIIEAHVANIEDDYDVLESIARRVKESEVINEWIEEMVAKTYIEIKPEYLSLSLDRPDWKEAAIRSAEGRNIKITDRPRPMPSAPTTQAAAVNPTK